MTLVTRFNDLNRYSVALLSWHKTNPVPTCSNKYLNDTEYCLFVRERGVPLYGGYKDHGTYWTTPCNKTDKDLYHHPTIKPLDIIRTMVRNSSKPGDIVLDPFMGSGTTGVQCTLEGREFIGIEKDRGYFETAERRIRTMKGAWFRPTVPIELFYMLFAFYHTDTSPRDHMANTSINSISAVVVGAVVQAVVVLAVLVPTIQSGAMEPREVENDPLAYTVYMTGSDLTGIDYGISQDGGAITVSYNNGDYTIDTSGGYKSLFISNGVQAVLNGTDMDVYTADGNCYNSCYMISGGPEVGGIGIMPTPSSEMILLETPSYAYLTIGKSAEAKAVQTNALYGVGDGSTLNGSSSLVMIGTQDDAIGVSGKGTVRSMEDGVEGGIIIDAGRHIVVTPTSTATESPVDVGGGNEGRTIDEGHIEGVRE